MRVGAQSATRRAHRLALVCRRARFRPRPDGGDSETVLASFTKAGIDTAALAARLQDEGASSFVKSWNDLMARIDSKRVAIRKAS